MQLNLHPVTPRMRIRFLNPENNDSVANALCRITDNADDLSSMLRYCERVDVRIDLDRFTAKERRHFIEEVQQERFGCPDAYPLLLFFCPTVCSKPCLGSPRYFFLGCVNITEDAMSGDENDNFVPPCNQLASGPFDPATPPPASIKFPTKTISVPQPSTSPSSSPEVVHCGVRVEEFSAAQIPTVLSLEVIEESPQPHNPSA